MEKRFNERFQNLVTAFSRLQEEQKLTSLGIDKRTGHEVLTNGKDLFWKNGRLIPVFANESRKEKSV